MGNKHTVHAATASPPLNVPTFSSMKDASDSSKADQNSPSGLLATTSVGRNPGTVEELSRQCKELFPTNFEGCRIIFNKGLSNHFQISHTLNMSNITPAGYRFGVTYVGTNMVGPGEAYPVLLGDIDPSGNLNANMIHQFHPRVKSKLVAQFQDNKCAAAQLTTDYKADTYTASCTLVNVDIINKSGIGVGHLLKNLTPKLDLGGELTAHFGPHVPNGAVAALSLVGRYTIPENDSVISAVVQPTAANIFYYKKIKENFQAGVELNTNLAAGESVASFGYQIDIPSADLAFRGSLDTNWQVGAVLEKKLLPLPLTLTLSGAIDHGSKHPSYKFGCGLVIG